MVVSQYRFRASRVVYRSFSNGVPRIFFNDTTIRDMEHVDRRLSGVVLLYRLPGYLRVLQVGIFNFPSS